MSSDKHKETGEKLKVERQTGTVKWFDERRGFGFIARETGKDVFVHFMAINGPGLRTLYVGEWVEFSVEQGPKGLRATHVTILI
jgi:CspA family cold shock protein